MSVPEQLSAYGHSGRLFTQGRKVGPFKNSFDDLSIESPNLILALYNTTFKEETYIRWCCRLSWHAFPEM